MITYCQGDASDPRSPGNRIIAHVCNDIGAWGRGFVLSLTQRWPKSEQMYRRWYQEQEQCLVNPDLSMTVKIGQPMKLGNVQYVRVDTREEGTRIVHTYVANMVGQTGIMAHGGTPPIRYDALRECLEHVAFFAQCLDGTTVHMPRIGCGLAGGKWSEVERIVQETLGEVPTYVYDFPLQTHVPSPGATDGVQERDQDL